jgi:hypothetical protein
LPFFELQISIRVYYYKMCKVWKFDRVSQHQSHRKTLLKGLSVTQVYITDGELIIKHNLRVRNSTFNSSGVFAWKIKRN